LAGNDRRQRFAISGPFPSERRKSRILRQRAGDGDFATAFEGPLWHACEMNKIAEDNARPYAVFFRVHAALLPEMVKTSRTGKPPSPVRHVEATRPFAINSPWYFQY